MFSKFYLLHNIRVLSVLLCTLLPFSLTFGQSGQLFQSVINKQAATALIGQELSSFGLLEVTAEDYSHLIGNPPDAWSLTVPATPGISPEITLKLERNDFLRPDFRVRRASDGRPVYGVDLGQHYVGEVLGHPGSKVALSLLEQELTATITYSDGERLALGKVKNQSDKRSVSTYVLFQDRQLAVKQEFDCSTPDTGIPYATKELTLADGDNKSSGGCIDLYFEIDYDIFFDKGSVDAAAQHLAANFNEVSILYAEINVDLNISEILVWDTFSPYFGTTSSAMLSQFQAQRTSFNGDLAQLVSYQASGGIAVLDGLCHPSTAARMSFSSIHPNFAAVPVFSWSTMVIAHELGHLLGSQHTHACVWNGNNTAIDGCSGLTEGLCGTPGIPINGGTIMSYCHLRPQGINFEFGLGPQPGAVIANRVAAAQGCVQAVCASGGNGGDNGGGEEEDPDDPKPISCDEQTVFVNVTLDDFGMETVWKLRTETGTILASGGPYPKKQKGKVMRDTVCVLDGCYVFEIEDLDGDGICCDYGQGRFELRDSSGTVIVPNQAFDSLAIADFCLPEVMPDEEEEEDNNVDCDVIDFGNNRVVSYGTNQDEGSVTIISNNEIMLENNAWKAVLIDYTVTPETWVSFWFKSTKQGEVHGIGLDNNEVLSSNLTFRVFGTQGWGIGEFNNYPGDGSWHFYQIPVGQFYTLDATYLFFTADHDMGTSDGNSYFRDVALTEGAPCRNTAALPETGALPTGVLPTLRLTPNPASNEINITLPARSDKTSFQVLDLAGRTVLTGTTQDRRFQLSVAELPNGTYLLRAGAESQRFVVAR